MADRPEDIDILMPAKKAPTSLPENTPTKADMASRAVRAQWGVMNNPQARAAIAALTLHYEFLDPLAGDIQILGSNIYFSISAWMKELHNKVPLNCRRWLKRHATQEEYDDLALEKWRRNAPEDRNGFVGHGSRLWLVTLQVRPWRMGSVQTVGDTGFSFAEPLGHEEHWWFSVSSAWGEASDLNCSLTVNAVTLLKADSRVLDAMAIKRGQDEILRESFSLSVKGAKSREHVEIAGMLNFQRGDAELAMGVGEGGSISDQPAGAIGSVGPDTKLRDIENAMRQYAIDSKIPPRSIDDIVQRALATNDPQAFIDEEAKRFASAAGETTGLDVPFTPGEALAEGTMIPGKQPAPAEAPAGKPRRRNRQQNPAPLPEAGTEADPLGDGGGEKSGPPAGEGEQGTTY